MTHFARERALALVASLAATLVACQPGVATDDLPPTTASGGVQFFGATASSVPFDVSIPSGLTPQEQLTPLAEFAWQEFIALNWPSSYSASSPTRGEPDSSVAPLQFSQFDPGQPLVWQTYRHRVEIFPMGVSSGGTTTYPDYPSSFDTPPQYFYRGVDDESQEIPPCAGSGPPLHELTTYFNNLDETTEINLATVFVERDPQAPGGPPPVGAPFYGGYPQQPRRFIYQAKANRAMFDYVLANELYDLSTRDTKLTNTYDAVRNQGLGGVAPCPEGVDLICFPPGVAGAGGREGSIEIKATWRQLTLAEYDSGRYVTGPILRYRNPGPDPETFCYEAIAGTPTETTLPYGLVGLHIIHKTTNVPTYVFATFEQVDNLDLTKPHNRIFFYNRNSGIVNPDRQDVTSRAHPIPPQVEAVNQTVHEQLRELLAGTQYDDSVWLYYKLIGVQGPTLDFVEGTDYFLANVTTETNEALRSFSGTLDNSNGTIDPSQVNLYSGTQTHTAGGCKGCHGNAQIGNPTSQQAADFSFITLNAPFDGRPDAVNQPLLKSRPEWYIGVSPPAQSSDATAGTARWEESR